jgi:hypothetical protein
MAMEPWIRIGQPLEGVLEDFERIFDAWELGGIRTMVFGRLLFRDEAGGFSIPAFSQNPEPYERRGLLPPNRKVEPDYGKEKLLHKMLENAKKRNWQLLVFCPGQGTSPVRPHPPDQDPYGASATAAVWEDVFESFPEADGGVMDGWTESAYELSYHHGNAVFADLNDRVKEQAEVRGYDPTRLERGMHRLRDRFKSLSPAEVRYSGATGLLSGLNLFDLNEDSLYWLRWRREDGLKEGTAFRDELDKLPRSLLLGNGLRSAVFSGMTAVDFAAWDAILDFLLVKHYFWNRGFDGMYGTVSRWVRQISEWNPELTEPDCFTVAKTWLGIELPEVTSLADMEMGFPQAFFDVVVQEETRRAIAAVSEPGKVVPWVDTGRMPHGGDPMTAGDLHRILTASEAAGLKRFLFHNHGHLTAAEWRVISRLCGQEWDENPDGFWPPATPRPSSF